MNEKKPYSDSRWHEPLKGKTVGTREFTEADKKKIERATEEMLKYFGVLDQDEEYQDD